MDTNDPKVTFSEKHVGCFGSGWDFVEHHPPFVFSGRLTRGRHHYQLVVSELATNTLIESGYHVSSREMVEERGHESVDVLARSAIQQIVSFAHHRLSLRKVKGQEELPLASLDEIND